MKRITSILLLLVFLFNAIGYYGLIFILRHQLNREFTKKLDAEEYPGSETMIVKIPYTLPYQVNFDGYERVDGEFECEGELYKLVKQKWVNDTLFIVLIKDSHQTKLNKSLAAFVKASNDTPIPKSTSKLIEHLEKHYLCSTNQIQIVSIGWCRKFSFHIHKPTFTAYYPPLLSPPPEFAFIL
ncbi:MAG: hypothetical protein ABI663_18205 [Chryseolinea sp.]